MDVIILFFVLLGGLILISLVLPWVNRGDLNSLRQEVQQLHQQINDLLNQISKKAVSPAEEPIVPIPREATEATTPAEMATAPATADWLAQQTEIPENSNAVPSTSQTVIQKQVVLPKKTKFKIDFEQQFGARLPVWVGAIALALAGFFLVKYSIQAGLLTEKVRVIVGIVFGISLMIAAHFIANKSTMANGMRIAQALSGAGIADLYLCIFAATNLYHLLPSLIGFLGMAIITAIAVILSLRHGMPIALLGLIGGLLTPALIHSQSPSAFLLFIYLYMVMLGLFIIIKKRQWWFLAFPLLIGAMLWVIFWLFFCYVPGDSLWLGLFLVAVSATYIVTSKQQFDQNNQDATKHFKQSVLLNYLTLGSAAVMMGIVGFKGGFGVQEWSLFGLLAAGGIIMAYFNQKLYGFVPWLLMIVNAVMLLSWNNPVALNFMTTTMIFALMYSCSGYYCLWRAVNPVSWAGLAGVSSVLYFLIAYYQLNKTSLFILTFSHPWQWGSIALLLSVTAVIIIWQMLNHFNEDKKIKQTLLAIMVLTAVAFFSIGIMILLRENMLPVAFATQVLAISWINTKVDINALRPVSGLLTVVFIVLLVPQLLSFIGLILNSLDTQGATVNPFPVIAASPLLQLGVPAMMFGYASWIFRVQQDDKLIKYLEVIAVILLSLMGYCLIRNAFHQSNNWFPMVSGFTERGVITNMFFFIALVSILISNRFARPILTFCGVILLCVGSYRIFYFDILMLNPLWSHQFVGKLPLLNALILPYGLPLLWCYVTNKQLQVSYKDKFIISCNSLCLMLLFVWVSLNVRQFFQGGYLDSDVATSAEIYCYSVVWLLLGIGLLVTGTLHHDKTIRIASLLVMILIVGKVFLYDAAALTGLYRVFSFLLLGLILMGLSWFYSRFVFIDKSTVKDVLPNK